MELRTFHDTIYGKYKGQLFVFESTWESFRPIVSVGWDGSQFKAISKFTSNLFDPYYGFGSHEMFLACKKLIQETELSESIEIKDPIQFWRWYNETNVKWWKDRPVVFVNPCIPNNTQSWKHYLKYLETRAKTVRRPYKGRSTRRLMPN
jgi:hypothetical protein